MLEQRGVNFERNKKEGVSCQKFTELMLSSGLAGKNVHWVTFDGSYDFAYLVKMLTQKRLPENLKDFSSLVGSIFGYSVFDTKYMASRLRINEDLERVATLLDVAEPAAIGNANLAGSDSLLTCHTFLDLVERLGQEEALKFAGILHGLYDEGPYDRFCTRSRSDPFHMSRSFSFRLINSNSTPRRLRSSATVPVSMANDTHARVIDGKSIAKQIREEITAEISRMKDAIGKVPGLAVVLVGSRKDSQTYVRNKRKACADVGITSYEATLSDDCSEEELMKHISNFNDDPAVHGILVQLPLPRHLKEEKILNAVSIHKDVDGFHPLNIGRLAMQGREPLFVPCTPKGCIELLYRSGVEIKGKRAVVIGRSNIVGMPAALLLQRENATVSIVHSHTKNPDEITKQADIVIAAAGVTNLVRGSWIKPGAVVIDVGINPVDDDSPKGYRLVGDVCYEEVRKVASAITPVPGGVGPMTIAMLLSNTLSSAKRQYNFK
ncbi:hypothetical protein H6P81_001007 [Aristolochia fimbriata]|uniref:Methenyltetrahydrofolate cyclohydrolase n=1 Tax=Aristolochia fimbriata TaxID=158543 RepID=A0AAV7F762_ARIFI|nr:hypothetical protein H6P81_001007 [Aristolochia fimbriata]